MPIILTIANVKGGVGKTTSAICLATALAGTRTVKVWDADPQATATEWAESAQDLGEPLPFSVEVINRARLDRKARQSTADYVLIDTPPGDPAMIDAAMHIADLVIMPTSPSVVDFQRMLQTASSVPAGIPKVALITQANKRTVVYREAMEFLATQDDIAVFSMAVGNRQAIQNSYGSRPDIFHEYSFITDEILEVTS